MSMLKLSNYKSNCNLAIKICTPGFFGESGTCFEFETHTDVHGYSQQHLLVGVCKSLQVTCWEY